MKMWDWLTRWMIMLGSVWLVQTIHDKTDRLSSQRSVSETALSPGSVDSNKLDFHTFLNSQLSTRQGRPKPPSRSFPSTAFRYSIDSIKWHGVIERLLEIRCSAERMSIVLHYERSYSRLPPAIVDILLKGRLYTEEAGPSSRNCQSVNTFGSSDGAITLSIEYDDCGVEMGRGSNWTIDYSVMVIFEAVFNVSVTEAYDQYDEHGRVREEEQMRLIRENYRFRCIQPVRTEGLVERASFSLLLSGEKYPRSYWSYPRSIELGELVYLYSEASLPWYKETGLYSFPVNCWTSPQTSSSSSQPSWKVKRKLFVKDGCPVNDNRGRGLSHIHHFKDGPTKVSVHLGQYLLFGDEYGDEGLSANASSTDPLNMVVLNCEVVPCVQSFTFGLLNIPKCPLSYYCAGIPQLSHALPVQLRTVQRNAVSAGPLIIRSKEERNAASTTHNSIDCRLACRQTQTEGKTYSAPSTIYVEGVKTQVVIVVASLSFSMGLLVMGALWWIHNQTEPSRLKAAMGEEEGESGTTAVPMSTISASSNGQHRGIFRLSRMKQCDDNADSSSMDDGKAGTSARLLQQGEPVIGLLKSPSLLVPTVTAPQATADGATARRLLNTLR